MLDKLNYGDIVTIGDYDGHYFRITSKQTITHEYENDPDEYEYMLELECAHTGFPHIAYADEIEVVATKDEAETFLADKPAPETNGGGGVAVFLPWWNDDDERLPDPPLTPKSRATLERERQARIDALIDEWTDNATKAEMLGDDDGFYKRRNDEVETEIKELSDVGVCEATTQ